MGKRYCIPRNTLVQPQSQCNASISSKEDFSEIKATWLSQYVGIFLSFSKGRVLPSCSFNPCFLPTSLTTATIDFQWEHWNRAVPQPSPNKLLFLYHRRDRSEGPLWTFFGIFHGCFHSLPSYMHHKGDFLLYITLPPIFPLKCVVRSVEKWLWAGVVSCDCPDYN